ncbi:MAG: GNAT family N-acetyltransferase [Pseudolysinimonas sp.]|uniref:GNAT family N-acetyltransferase n=1 Tax=Pseudolysinimonas sp. TaxID=2680009 RepID=UPI003C72D4F2
MSGFSIEELDVPATIDDPSAAAFIDAVEVGNVVAVEAFGTPDIVYEPAEELPQFHNAFQPHRMLVARSEGRIVAQAVIETTVGDEADTSWVHVAVHPEFQGRGVGRDLADRVEAAVRADGRRKAIACVPGRDNDGERLASPTGFGTIAADARATRFMLARGYRFEQVERLSRLELPVPDLDGRVAAAEAASGADYRVHTWIDRTPERWLEDRAALATRMSTDIPSAGLEYPLDVWTVERVRDADDRRESHPRRSLVAAAEHVPSGRLVAFTLFSVPRQEHRAVQQYATLRHAGAPWAPARDAGQSRQPRSPCRDLPRPPQHPHLQRRREPAHARRQRGARFRADRLRGRLAKGSVVTFTIDELAIPKTAGADGWHDFVRAVEVGNAVDAITFGTPDIAYEPAEELPSFHDPHKPAHLLVARVDGEIVGRGWVEMQADDPDTAWSVMQVLPEVQGRGIGRGLAAGIEDLVRRAGRRKILAYASEHETGGERRVPPTGFGSVAAGSRTTRFLDANGYRLEQVNRVSRIALPVAAVAESLEAARGRSGPDFAIHRWIGGTPERWLADIATLVTRMSIDAPDAGLETPEDVWTAERVASEDARRAAENPRRLVTSAVEHVPTGRLVAFTEFSVPPHSHRAAMQYATLVLPEYRGNGLGMLVKLANLDYLPVASPGHPSVVTFNAEENRHMLAVNEALGFLPIAVEGAWRKDLT